MAGAGAGAGAVGRGVVAGQWEWMRKIGVDYNTCSMCVYGSQLKQ